MSKTSKKAAPKPAVTADKAVAKHLAQLLADSYVLFLKTQNYHWNVTGPSFGTLHLMFETQYQDLFAAIDEVAERLRALDVAAPGSFAAFAKLTDIKEETASPNATQMIRNLVKDHEIIMKTAQGLIDAADDADDDATEDLAIKRMQIHQKHHWMLKAHLE